MATTTTKFGLRKPAASDPVDVAADIGAAMDIIDPLLVVGAAATALRPTGALYETVSRINRLDNSGALVSGRMNLAAIYLPAGTTVTNITFVSATTALSTGSNQWFALYSAARAKLAVTADDTNTAWAGGAPKTLALTEPYAITESGIYYLGICVVASTVPSLLSAVNLNASVTGLAPITTGTSDTGLTDPASAPATAAAITATASIPYAYVS